MNKNSLKNYIINRNKEKKKIISILVHFKGELISKIKITMKMMIMKEMILMIKKTNITLEIEGLDQQENHFDQ